MDVLQSPIRFEQDDFGRHTDKLNWLVVQPKRITRAWGASQSKKLMWRIKEIYLQADSGPRRSDRLAALVVGRDSWESEMSFGLTLQKTCAKLLPGVFASCAALAFRSSFAIA
jgi:hypothetical protein